MDPKIVEERQRIDAFHERFTAAKAAGSSVPGDENNHVICGGCFESLPRSEAQICGACKCTAYCNRECQRLGWRGNKHRAACQLLSRARSLPAADPGRTYVVQLKLEGREGLLEWAARLERADQGELAAIHREMAAALSPRQRVLFALEARHHVMMRFQMVPPKQRLEAPDLLLFTLSAILEPTADIPTLNMPRTSPHRPYAVWVPGGSVVDRAMDRPLGDLLAGAGLAASDVYVGGGFCQEFQQRPELQGSPGADGLVSVLSAFDPDYFTDNEDEGEEEEDEEEDEGEEAGAEHRPEAAVAAPAAAAGGGAPPALRILVVAGLHMFGAAGEGEDPLLTAVAEALRAAGADLQIVMYNKRGGAAAESALASRLDGGGFTACVVLGLGSGDDFKPRKPTHPWGDGPWRDGLAAWVHAGGVLAMHGERAAAAVARSFFGLQWVMEGDWYRRTDHRLNAQCPLLGPLARQLPTNYNVKACMLSSVPPEQRVYASVEGATTYSNVPFMAGASVRGGMCAMAAAPVGQGAVVFFGDVNWEPPTMSAIAQLTKKLVAARGRQAA